MSAIVLSIWILQGALMFFDEFYFHQKRGLGKWESVGHPVDSFFFLLCYLYCIFFSFQSYDQLPFYFLAIFSTIIITKDEWIHKKESFSTENWLHSMLFIIHPISLAALYFAWKNELNFIIQIQASIITFFMIFQISYWNIFRRQRYETRS